MMKIFTKKSKKGITLVESVFAVVILAILTIGIISLLTAGGVKIFQISAEAVAYSQAVQKMDLIISAISNGCCVIKDEDSGTYELIIEKNEGTEDGLVEVLDLGNDVNISAFPENHADGSLRGWYLTVTYQGATVKGFVSNSEGVFDRG